MCTFVNVGCEVADVVTRKGFAFVPRKLFTVPGSFGQINGDLEPVAGTQGDDPMVRAALLQHHLANKVREYLLSDSSRTMTWFASEDAGHPAVGVARMRRMLRGETQMQLTDLTFITSRVPETIEFAVQWLGFDLREKNREIQEANYQVTRFQAKLSRCTCGAAD